MSKSKHTPGPWIAISNAIIKAQNGRDVADTRGIYSTFEYKNVSDKHRKEMFAEQKANVRLIAAAPEYASEVEEAIGWLNSILETNARSADEVFEILTVMRDRFVKLQAKATGGSDE
jgi:hypothetical protein